MADKLEVMKSVLSKMEDIKNSQQSLIEKLGQVEVALFDSQSEDMDKHLEKVHKAASDSFDEINVAIEEFEIKKNKLELDL